MQISVLLSSVVLNLKLKFQAQKKAAKFQTPVKAGYA